MNQELKIIELFSGIGGFSKGLADAGFNITEHYFSEIDKHAIANYKYNFPNAKYIGSVTDISGRDFSGIDIITFGSPCQDFSLAGKREGMDGKRSVLILEAIRLITELRPTVFIWENVKGAFSSNSGADFWGILQAFANIGGYRLEWQLLNTKWFLPQNRERIYLVGHLAESERSFGNVFPISEDNCGINERSGEARSIRTLTAGGNSGGLHSSMTLVCDSCKSRQREKREIMPPLRANTGAGHGNYLLGAIRGRNPDNPTARIVGQKTEQMLEINKEGVSNTLTSVQKDNVVIGIKRDFKGEVGFRIMKDNISPKIQARAREDGSGQPIISYSMGSGKKGRSCINSGRIPEIGNEEHSIRRLTEIECERLQGFPDDWTRYGLYEKQVWINKKEGTFEIVQDVHEIPKTQRYKMLGNAVTRDVVEEIGKRLLKN
ncbi:DNA cytosine methyltransferase [Chryseobacterium indoltheticum]|uniref:Cytosine-specific methyltransferase n=1 Tax=Chryseobacterium indoltheticum TaxID=254 RepID=A0A381FAH4_9FLAO|nr:DNA (cytosine-5-)-methyltransferase [Chryseobacterium indoltheticum]AZA73544.1 DNA (cytosine-5-)-methyltransferase [Chryseobacterium indoltheticum]SIR24909.1 DNA (cytosine-5)-methyltransferase 1 [Chryseobacterium indoltheticum]SUX43468.1 Modification methylase BanI [Chryseobacterium indoltheticum]